MVWLDICDDYGNSFYFDIHHVERKRVARRWQHAVSGICGNGLIEISVLVEPGGQGEVTYVDFTAQTDSMHQLLDGLDVDMLDDELLAIARQKCGLVDPWPQPHRHLAHVGAPHVCEEDPAWQASV